MYSATHVKRDAMTLQQPKPVRVGLVMHSMQVAGAEMLVAEAVRRLVEKITPTIFCLDAVGALGEQLQKEGVEIVCLRRPPRPRLAGRWEVGPRASRTCCRGGPRPPVHSVLLRGPGQSAAFPSGTTPDFHRARAAFSGRGVAPSTLRQLGCAAPLCGRRQRLLRLQRRQPPPRGRIPFSPGGSNRERYRPLPVRRRSGSRRAPPPSWFGLQPPIRRDGGPLPPS